MTTALDPGARLLITGGADKSNAEPSAVPVTVTCVVVIATLPDRRHLLGDKSVAQRRLGVEFSQRDVVAVLKFSEWCVSKEAQT